MNISNPILNLPKEEVQKIVDQVGYRNGHLIAQTYYMNNYPKDLSERENERKRIRELAKNEGFIDVIFSEDESGQGLFTLFKVEVAN